MNKASPIFFKHADRAIKRSHLPVNGENGAMGSEYLDMFDYAHKNISEAMVLVMLGPVRYNPFIISSHRLFRAGVCHRRKHGYIRARRDGYCRPHRNLSEHIALLQEFCIYMEMDNMARTFAQSNEVCLRLTPDSN